MPSPLLISTSYCWFFNPLLVEAVLEEGNMKGQMGSAVFLKCQHIQFVWLFCVNFLLSSEAPNSAELKWNEVIRAAGCEDVLGLAWKCGAGGKEEEKRDLKRGVDKRPTPRARSLGKPPLTSLIPWSAALSLALLPKNLSWLAPHNQTPPSISSPLFRNSHQINLSSAPTKLILLLLYHSSLCLWTCNYYTLLK